MELYCTPKEAFDIIPMLPQIYDEPFGDSSSIPTYLVSKLAVKSVKVALSADGGDEQFCGYTRYWMVKKINRIISHLSFFARPFELISPEHAFKIYSFFKPILPKWTNFRDKYMKFINVLKAENLFDCYDISNKYFLPQEFRQLGLKKWIEKNQVDMREITLDPLTFMMFYDMKTYLPDDILVKVDRATMSVSLEGREPFLDHRIVEFTCKLPPQMKYRDGVSKYLLRKILYKYIPPKLIERPKMGFGVPIYEWFKRELRPLYEEYLNKSRINREGIFNPETVDKLLKDYFDGKGVNHYKLWLIFIFEMWYEKWMH
ncbi:MAG: asparagine synthase C-terminal domain-containing protein [Aquificaceae bacterium]|nr:asparagine synthase C-terminal domain-containing protein [Aquificaceae bacterium]